jgi:hypothetical protein
LEQEEVEEEELKETHLVIWVEEVEEQVEFLFVL